MSIENERKITEFHTVANSIADLLYQKNTDYGDSFHDVYREFGDLSTYIRLKDKLGRLGSFVKRQKMLVERESMNDVYMDIAGYCILTLVSRMKILPKEVNANAMDRHEG